MSEVNITTIREGAITDLQATEVFCTDIFYSIPDHPRFSEVAKTIIHPEDVEDLSNNLSKLRLKEETVFRIITNSGAERKIILTASARIEQESLFNQANEVFVTSKLELSRLHLKEQVYNEQRKAENIAQLHTDSGNWHYNEVTGNTYYSDNCYRIFGLPVQGLNAHPNTFTPFIHPEDSSSLHQAIETMLKKHLPLHLNFRIIRQDGVVRHLFQITHWTFNELGQNILHGLIQDITEKKEQEHAEEMKNHILDHTKELLQQVQKLSSIAHFEYYYNTKAFYYSSNLEKLSGIKRDSFSSDFKSLFLIGDTKESQKLEEAYNNAINHKIAPDLEFKTIVQDGKSRYLKMTGCVIKSFDGDCLIGFLKDITAETVVQIQLERSSKQNAIQKELLTTVENNTGAATILFDYKTPYVTTNNNGYRFFDQKPKSSLLTKNDLLSRIHHEDQLLLDAIFSVPFIENEKQLKIRIQIGNKLRSLLVFVKHVTSNPQLISAIFYDVTASEDLTIRLNHHLATMQELAYNIEDALIILDPNYCITFWNNKCDLIFQTKQDDAIGMNFFEVAPAFKRTTVFESFHKALNGENMMMPLNGEFPTYTLIEIKLRPLKNHLEQITGLVLSIKDKGRKEMDEQVGQWSNLITKVLEYTSQPVIVLDNNLNYLFWNKKAEEEYNVCASSIIGRNILEFFPFHDCEDYFNGFRKVLKGETVVIDSTSTKERFKQNVLSPVLR